MTRLVVLSERLSTRANAQDRVVPVLLPEQRSNPFAGHLEVRGASHGVRCLRSANHTQRQN